MRITRRLAGAPDVRYPGSLGQRLIRLAWPPGEPEGSGEPGTRSRKGICWDNAPMESFFHTFKTELVHHAAYATREAAKRDLFAYIEGYYNRASQHASLYVVEENRLCWAGSDTAGCFGLRCARRTMVCAASAVKSSRLKIQGPSGKGCIASISPLSAAIRSVRGATPTRAAA